MRRVGLVILCIVSTLFLFAGKSVLAYQNPGSPSGYVNDFGEMLSSETKTTLEEKLTTFTKETSSEIIVVTLPNLGGDSIENFANELFREWGIGTKENNNGVLLLVARDERQVRIEVGYGLEGALPDIVSSAIIRNEIVPLFKNEDYNGGVVQGVDSIIQATRGEYTAASSSSGSSTSPFKGIEILFFILFVGFNIFVSLVAPSKSWWLGGVIGGVVGSVVGFIFWSILGGAIVGGVFLLLGLLIDFIVSKSYYQDGGHHGGMWGGGGFGGFGRGGGGGFGGFSGGSSGGGGASGNW